MPEVMTALPPVPRTAAAASKRLFTHEEYQAMGRAGILDEAGRYRETQRYEPGEALAPSALPDLRLDVASIVPARSRS